MKEKRGSDFADKGHGLQQRWSPDIFVPSGVSERYSLVKRRIIYGPMSFKGFIRDVKTNSQ